MKSLLKFINIFNSFWMEFEGNVYVYKELKKKNYWFMLKYGVGLKYVCLFCLLCDWVYKFYI